MKIGMKKRGSVRAELCAYGVKIAAAHLVAGAGGNISAREGNIVWMKPSGLAMDEITPADLCGLDLATGRQVRGDKRPTSEFNMHLGVYRMRPDAAAVFHTHSPWASGVISSGVDLKPMFAEFIVDLGRVGKVGYITPTTEALADAVADEARDHDTILMVNHGVLAVGVTMRHAYFKCVVVEDAAISMVAASVVGRPRFLTPRQSKELLALDRVKHRISKMERN